MEENVKVGLHNQMQYGMVSGIFRLPGYWKEEKIAHERAMELLSIFDMEDLARIKAGSLPYGAQRRLEIVRALATNPSLLLLDEPAAGMNPSETAELMENIRKIRDTFQIAVTADRARHESGHEHLRGHLRAELRQDHRQGHPGGDSGQSRRSLRHIWARQKEGVSHEPC